MTTIPRPLATRRLGAARPSARAGPRAAGSPGPGLRYHLDGSRGPRPWPFFMQAALRLGRGRVFTSSAYYYNNGVAQMERHAPRGDRGRRGFSAAGDRGRGRGGRGSGGNSKNYRGSDDARGGKHDGHRRGGYNWRKHLPEGHPQKHGHGRHRAVDKETWYQEKRMNSLNALANMGIDAGRGPSDGDAVGASSAKDAAAAAASRGNGATAGSGPSSGLAVNTRVVDHDPQALVIPEETKRDLAKALSRLKSSDDINLPTGSAKRTKNDSRSARHAAEESQQGVKAAKIGVEDLVRMAAEPHPKLAKFREGLPVYQTRESIVETVRGNRITVISGATGCGKTTQVPQFILDDLWARSEHCNIVCTQPRRISAIGVSERVAAERGEKVGTGTVGYQIRLERRANEQTRMLFCTTGLLLRRLQVDAELDDVTHIILDEVHERSIDSDFLIVILRDLLARRPDLRVVLMSATLDADMFAKYFGDAFGEKVPVLHIPGRTFPVEALYLEDAVQVTGCRDLSAEGRGGSQQHHQQRKRRPKRPRGQDEDSGKGGGTTTEAQRQRAARRAALEQSGVYSRDTVRTVMDSFDEDEIPLQLVGELLTHIDATYPVDESEGHAVLVFLPGWEDIRKLHEQLDVLNAAHRRWALFPLHGAMGTAQQRGIFGPPPPGKRKVILATNIAESSITIDDVSFVIDSCKHKEKTYDPVANISCLLPTWVSRASALQRRGRAGRVRAGTCWHLVPRDQLETSFDEHALPEMVRTPLEELCLQVRALDVAPRRKGGLFAFLNKALTPPSEQSLVNAIDLLNRIGALAPDDESLTALGQCLATLPLGPQIGKSLVMACVLGCLDPILTLTALLSQRTIFVAPLNAKEAADKAKSVFAADYPSDHMAMLNAFAEWTEAEGRRQGKDFAWRHYLNHNQLLMARDVREQYLELLRDARLVNTGPGGLDAQLNRNANNWAVVKACLLAGLYPHVGRLDIKRRRALIFIKGLPTVKPHPGSVNARTQGAEWRHRWVAFHDKVRTAGGVFLYDTSEVAPLPIVMFGEAALADEGVTVASMKDVSGSARAKATPEQREAARLVREIVDAKGGSVPLAWLSHTLRSARPDLKMAIGKIRPFLANQGFTVDKVDGVNCVTLESPKAKEKRIVKLQEWIYFACHDPDLPHLVSDCRWAVDRILQQVVRKEAPTASQVAFIDALCDAFSVNETIAYDDIDEDGNMTAGLVWRGK